jgi:hypothetical protein
LTLLRIKEKSIIDLKSFGLKIGTQPSEAQEINKSNGFMANSI